jgi:hypothetical protein
MRARRALVALLFTGLVALLASCGGRFELPTEQRDIIVPTDQSYAMIATWTGQDGIQDLLITQDQGGQLFALFNTGGDGPFQVPRGRVVQYPFSGGDMKGSTVPVPTVEPYFYSLLTLFNPVAIAAGSAPQRLFVLDQGDSCLAKFDPRRNSCAPDEDTTHATGHPFRNQIFEYRATWRVREYSLRGDDTISTFTDTTFAKPYGITADDQGRVYVAGLVVVLDTNQVDQRIRTRKHVSRIYRYKRGTRYPGVLDVNMPGTDSWHRDTTWVVFDGTGNSSVSDPRGIQWSPRGPTPLFVADRGNNQVKGVSSVEINTPIVRTDGSVTGATFNHPEAVAADRNDHFYVVDRENRRVLRFHISGEFIQRVDVEPNADGLPLLDPTSIAVNDSVAYIADRGRGQIVRYLRRP